MAWNSKFDQYIEDFKLKTGIECVPDGEGGNQNIIKSGKATRATLFGLLCNIMLAGIFVFWWGGAIYFAIKFEKLIRFIIQKIKTKRVLKNEIKQTH
ncbi:hypothetical protein [Spiroplasma endosymbiont of Dromius quadrimaculatus]|uniref:hypothetical protein n=1 Tax=Spiroplasma endosymbiont of Dromius quadrimaculatus TaxID=3066283 RepID=UPI00313D3D34